jgi:hypothetical protein
MPQSLLVSLGDFAILVGYFLFTLFMLRMAFSRSKLPVRLLIISLLFAQFCVKLIDRFYLAAYPARAGDENIWLNSLALYKSSGKIPLQGSLEGPGIYYLVYVVASAFHIDYTSALTWLAIVLGSCYLVPTFIMYRVFFEGNTRLAFASTLLVSMADVMVYSTTIARPTLFGLFLMPIAVGAFQSLRGRFRLSTFIILVFSSIAILIMHAPITYVVLLSLVSFTILIFDKVGKWEAAYIVILFASYGLALLFLPLLETMWKTDFFGVFPLNLVSAFMGSGFYLIFPTVSCFVLVLSSLLRITIVRIRMQGKIMSPEASRVASYIFLGLVSLGGLIFSILTLSKYAFVIGFYGIVGFALLHAWKILFTVIGLIGLKTIATRYNRTSNDTTLSWLLSVAVIVVVLAAIAPLTQEPGWAGLFNVDERFAEFAYFPAIYFVTVGLNCLAARLPTRIFRWIILPLIASYAIPSIMVGTLMLFA